MSRGDDEEQERGDWTEALARAAGALGFNETRVRWKLQIWRRKLTRARRRTDQAKKHITYEHKVCPSCGQINDGAEEACTSCGQAMAGRRMEVLSRVGASMPRALSVSGILGLCLALVYVRCIAAEWPDPGILDLDVETLIRLGGHWAPAVQEGQHWRWLTCVFLHAGLWHIGFNLFALSQIGPAIEEIFGRGRTLLLFVITGLCGSVGSYLWGMYGVGIGASGAIMGLCGVAAGWGQREGTTVGRELRNMMLKWAVYTILFGFFIGADNAAHTAGFLSGGFIGFALQPGVLRRTERKSVAVIQGVLGGVAVAAAVGLCMVPPALPEGAEPRGLGRANNYAWIVKACRMHDEGDPEAALEQLRASYPEAQYTEEMAAQTCKAMSAMARRCRDGFSDLDSEAASAMREYCRMLKQAEAAE